MKDLRNRPVFICGYPKAGTTLLRNLLDSHPQLVVFPEETLFFRRFLRKADGLDSQSLLDLAEQEIVSIFGEDAEKPNNPYGDSHQGYGDISVERLKSRFSARIARDGLRHPGDVLSAVVLAFGDLVGYPPGQARWWVEKTPYNEQFTGQVLKWWPAARFIHIVREPCDNFASYQRKHRDWGAGFFSEHWNRSTTAGIQNIRQHGPKKYLMMPYEDLVQQPEEKLAEICAFLEIDDHPSLRQPTKRGQPWRGNSMFDDRFNAISAAAVGRWQTVLTPEEAAVIQLTTRKHRRALGYRQESPKTVRAWFISLYWRLHPVLYDLVKGPKKDW
mgnify:CR=1 FL=1